MGIRHLQTFMQKHLPNGYVDVSIKDECQQFLRQHNQRPVIIVDLMGLVNLALVDPRVTLCAGRHNMYKLLYEKLIHNLSLHADLIFFLDGPVVNQKFDTWTKRQNARYDEKIGIFDLMYQGVPLQGIVNKLEPPSITTHLSVIKHVVKKYGQIITTFTAECDTEIARYASLNPRVIAVLANDTDFLIFPGKWKYFSLSDMNHETLMTKEYSRTELRRHLLLNDFQMIIFATITGNDVIKFEEVQGFHKSMVGYRNECQNRFRAISKYIRENLPSGNDTRQLYTAIASQVFGNTSMRIMTRIKESFDMFNIHFDIQEPTDPLLKLCHNNSFDFVYSILMKMRRYFTLLYYDLRIKVVPSAPDVEMIMFRKHLGIVLKHEEAVWQNSSYEIAAKISHQDVFRTHYVNPIFPPQTLPPLIELLQREKFPAYDPLRFELLKWTVSDDEKLRNMDLEQIPANFFLDILVLSSMVLNKIIDPLEADILLLSIKHVNLNAVPENLQVPQVLDPKAFRVAFLFTKFYSLLCRSLEATGLKMLKKVINFDGVLFHDLYSKFQTNPFNDKLLIGELIQYCPYK